MMMTVEDPVCRNTIPLENAHASQEYGGWAYFFCSSRCHADFKLIPNAMQTRAFPPPSARRATPLTHPAKHDLADKDLPPWITPPTLPHLATHLMPITGIKQRTRMAATTTKA